MGVLLWLRLVLRVGDDPRCLNRAAEELMDRLGANRRSLLVLEGLPLLVVVHCGCVLVMGRLSWEHPSLEKKPDRCLRDDSV